MCCYHVVLLPCCVSTVLLHVLLPWCVVVFSLNVMLWCLSFCDMCFVLYIYIYIYLYFFYPSPLQEALQIDCTKWKLVFCCAQPLWYTHTHVSLKRYKLIGQSTFKCNFQLSQTYAAFTVNTDSTRAETLPLNLNHSVTSNFRTTDWIRIESRQLLVQCPLGSLGVKCLAHRYNRRWWHLGHWWQQPSGPLLNRFSPITHGIQTGNLPVAGPLLEPLYWYGIAISK